jgi:hypothetical protein
MLLLYITTKAARGKPHIESLKKVYTYTIHIHNVYTGLFGRNVRGTAENRKNSGTASN